MGVWGLALRKNFKGPRPLENAFSEQRVKVAIIIDLYTQKEK